MKNIYDEQGRLWRYPDGWEPGKPGHCKGCNQVILWCKNTEGANRPVNANGILHFETCTAREQRRSSGRSFNEPPPFFGIDTVEPPGVGPEGRNGPQTVGETW